MPVVSPQIHYIYIPSPAVQTGRIGGNPAQSINPFLSRSPENYRSHSVVSMEDLIRAFPRVLPPLGKRITRNEMRGGKNFGKILHIIRPDDTLAGFSFDFITRQAAACCYEDNIYFTKHRPYNQSFFNDYLTESYLPQQIEKLYFMVRVLQGHYLRHAH